MEAHHVDVPALAVSRHREQLWDIGESRLARQLRRDVVIVDLADGIDFDLAFLHRVSTAHLHVRVHPDSHAARDVAAADCIAQALGEDHEPSLHPKLTKSARAADHQTVAIQVCLKAQPPTRQPRAKRAEGGFVVIATAISMTLLLGLAGLAIDLGRMYVIRSELQSFTDAAALAAARELDGTAAGFDRARSAAARLAQGPHAMRWDMGTQTIANITTGFPSDPSGTRSARVMVAEPAPAIFLRLFQSRTSTTIAAASVATKDGTNVRLTQ